MSLVLNYSLPIYQCKMTQVTGIHQIFVVIIIVLVTVLIKVLLQKLVLVPILVLGTRTKIKRPELKLY